MTDTDTSLTARVRGAHPATIAFWAGVLVSIGVWWYVGRRQWFILDDWSFLVTRDKMRVLEGQVYMYLTPQDGHWMTPPIAVYRLLRWSFGYRSYWPYLGVLLASHLAIVLCVRRICWRMKVEPWTTTLICGVLLVFGSGWENIVFAIQITYNFSLLAFLAQILLTDHDGPVDRRDWIGSALAVFGVMSSGFGPFFIFGIALLLGLRRRWAAMAVAVIPQALAWGWWWIFWGGDEAADQAGRAYFGAIKWAIRGLMQPFGGLAGSMFLAGGAAILTAAIIAWQPIDWRRRSTMIALAATSVVMYLGIGVERATMGIESAPQSRYAYMAAMMVAPIYALGLDQARRFSSWGIWFVRVLLVLSIGRNTQALRDYGDTWADVARNEQRLIALIAGTDLQYQADPNHQPLPFSPDVHVSDIPWLVIRHAVEPRPPTTPAEIAEVERALGLPPGTGSAASGG